MTRAADSSGVTHDDSPGPIPRCRVCQGPVYICELPDGTCRFATTARSWLEQMAPAGPDEQLDIPALAVLLRSTEDGAWERLSAALTKKMAYLDGLLDRFRDVVDDVYGMQPVLDWAGLIDVVEREGNRRHLRMQQLGAAAEAAEYHINCSSTVLAHGRAPSSLVALEKAVRALRVSPSSSGEPK